MTVPKRGAPSLIWVLHPTALPRQRTSGSESLRRVGGEFEDLRRHPDVEVQACVVVLRIESDFVFDADPVRARIAALAQPGHAEFQQRTGSLS